MYFTEQDIMCREYFSQRMVLVHRNKCVAARDISTPLAPKP